jgi:translation initiation factor IF-2
MSGNRIGEVTHFFDRIGVAVIVLTDMIRVGDTVHLLGRATDFTQEVKSLQIEHQPVTEAGAGQEVAMKVTQRVHPHDAVFKITDETTR